MIDKEEQQLDMENAYWQVMNEETKELCERTIAEVKKYMPKESNVSLLSEIPYDICQKICEDEGIRIVEDLLKQATKPMALAKYLRIISDDMKNTQKVKNDLKSILDENKFDWFVSDKLDYQITIANKLEVNSEEKPKSLTLKYSYDPENDVISYALIGQTWNWEISKDMLLIILNNETSQYHKQNDKKTEVFNQKDNIELKVGDVVISIKHK